MESVKSSHICASSIALMLWETLSTIFLCFHDDFRALSILLRVNCTWFEYSSSVLWRQRLSTAKCQSMLEAIARTKQRQIYANKIVKLQDVYPSIIFASFTPHFSSRHPDDFDYHSQIQFYCQSHGSIHGLYFPKLAHISLGNDNSYTSVLNTAFVKALCHFLHSQLQKLECVECSMFCNAYISLSLLIRWSILNSLA
jgi:hypothetical protein